MKITDVATPRPKFSTSINNWRFYVLFHFPLKAVF
eukprot:CCRYP_006570-RA/>CCRYP_006570-RA protein AED:0.46 eAED:0.46 QI:9/1/1/1/0/0/2/101/34